MDEKKIKMHLPKIDDLFTTQEERDNINNEKVIELDINNIDDFPNHPFKVVNNEEMEQMKESIKDNGVLVPALVRQKEDGRYEMISGHRRKFASNKLRNEIISRKYKVGKYKQFIIYEPKKRLIEALPYRDRVLLMCFCEYSLIPRLENKLIYDNVACRKTKGTLFGMERLEKFLKKEFFKGNNNNVYYLKCDIKKYFPNINHNILIKKLKDTGFSEDEMWYLEKIIKEQPNNIDKGLPLGNQSSQWFALFYLDTIDRLIKEKLQIKGYIRYMDDFILIHRDKKYLQYCLKEIDKVCKEELDLELNQKTQIGIASNGIDFLGFRHILTPSGKVIRKLRLSAKKRLRRHLKNLEKLQNKNVIDEEYVTIRKNAFYAHILYSNENYFKKICLNED